MPTYRDVEDFAAHGDDYRATRLYRWLKQSADEGMPVNARGIVCDTEQRMLDYYFTYLDLFRSLQQRGYAYRGEDEICFGSRRRAASSICGAAPTGWPARIS